MWQYKLKQQNFTKSDSEFYLDRLTHWDQEMHICISNLTIIGSDNGLLPGRRQAIIGTNAGNIADMSLRNKHQWNVNRNSCISPKKCVWKCRLVAILSRPQCVEDPNLNKLPQVIRSLTNFQNPLDSGSDGEHVLSNSCSFDGSCLVDFVDSLNRTWLAFDEFLACQIVILMPQGSMKN